MSSKNRGTETRKNENYPTPAWAVHDLLAELRRRGVLGESRSERILDPCAGEGDLLRAVLDDGYASVSARELREECREPLEALTFDVEIGNSLSPSQPGPDRDQWVISNPPFSLADDFVVKFTPNADGSAWLQQLDWIVPTVRDPMLDVAGDPDLILTLRRRPAFISRCNGIPATKKRPVAVKGCGRTFDLVPKATGPRRRNPKCPCGGVRTNATDSREYAWFVWFGKGFRTGTTVMYRMRAVSAKSEAP